MANFSFRDFIRPLILPFSRKTVLYHQSFTCVIAGQVAGGLFYQMDVMAQALEEESDVEAMDDDVDPFLHPIYLTFRLQGKVDADGEAFGAGGMYNIFCCFDKVRVVVLFRKAQADGKVVRA